MAVLYLAKGVFKLCLLTILFIILNTCAREITTNNSNDGDGKDQSDPLTAARNAVKNIDVATQPNGEYVEGQQLDVNNNIMVNNKGSLKANNNLYTMPDDPEHQVKESNPNKWQTYYAEEKIPEPPPLPKLQENPFQTVQEISENADKLDKVSGKK